MEEVEGLESLVLLGGGGFADVYRGHEPAFSRDVAVKVFHDHLDDRGRRSFEREASAAGRLSGIRNVVHVYRSDVTTSGRPYLVMELMHGSLEDALTGGPIPVDTACSIGALLGTALGEAHARGVLHRDIKPANVLIDRYGEPALTDFGIASVTGSGQSVTVGGAFTAEHAAPEFFDGAAATETSDVYSFASTLFTMMEGHPPFSRADGEGPLPFMQRVKSAERPDCAAALAVSEELNALLLAALSPDPDRRPRLKDLVAGLREHAGSAPPLISVGSGVPSGPPRATAGATTSPPPTGSGDPRRGTAWRWLVGTAAMLAAIVVGVVFISGSDSDDLEPDPDEAAGGPETTASTTTQSTVLVPRPTPRDGVNGPRPLQDPSVTDTSPTLRANINSFAAGSTLPVISKPPLQELTADTLGFGQLPAVLDYASSNKETTDECLRVVLNDLVIVGAAGTLWLDESTIVQVLVVQVASEQQARQYFWSTSLFLGLRDEQCDGWPADRIAVDPEELEVARIDFEVPGVGDELVTVINEEPGYRGTEVGIAYESVFRIGDTVIVANVGFLRAGTGADEAAAAAAIAEVATAFGN